VYGTQLLMPFSNYPFAVGSIFIIDPLYTVPLLVGLVAGVARREWRGLPWVHAGLVLSTAYLAWSAAVQWHVREHALASLSPEARQVDRVLVTPMPFNTILWRVVAMRPDGGYEEGFYSLLDGGRAMRFDRFDPTPVPGEVRTLPRVQQLAAFSHGFYRLHARGGQAWITDLRMGQEPHYSFSFLVARQEGGGWTAVTARNHGSRGDVRRALAWMWERLLGQDVPPPR